MRQENGLSNKGDPAHFEDIIQLNNHDNTNGAREKTESMATEAILTFESEQSFMKKAGPMKPQHVAGEDLEKSFCCSKQGAELFQAESLSPGDARTQTRSPVVGVPSFMPTTGDDRGRQVDVLRGGPSIYKCACVNVSCCQLLWRGL